MVAPTSPGWAPWRAYRWVPFVRTIGIRGIDLTDQTMTAQVRQYRDAPDSALIDLAMATAGSQGISVTAVTVDGVPTSTIKLQINETTIEGLLPANTNGQEPDTTVDLKWAMHIGSGLAKVRWFEGDFTIVPGANQA